MPGKQLAGIPQVEPDIGVGDAQVRQQGNLQRNDGKPEDGERENNFSLGRADAVDAEIWRSSVLVALIDSPYNTTFITHARLGSQHSNRDLRLSDPGL